MDNPNCLICTVPISVARLGVDACRACAAFFKRAYISGRTYTCRQGDRKCAFRKYEKFACRSCRYDRCVELGMIQAMSKRQKALEAEGDESQLRPSPSTTESLLGIMEEQRPTNFRASYDRRLVQEKRYAAMNNLKRLNHPTEELYVSTVSSVYESFRILIKESITILQNVFEDFERHCIAHKVILFKNFLGKFCMAEGVYLSLRYFRNNTFNFMTSLITCADSNDLDGWVTDADNIERKDDFRAAMKGFSKDYIDLLVPMLKMEECSAREFHALIVLAYCDVDPSLNLPEEIVERARLTKARVFEELQEYYRTELGLKEFSGRLGTLMTVAYGVGEAGNLMYEEMRMYSTMFGVYSDDQLFRELFFE
ncbi:hypothetical protein PMAYCL1PPCAC_31438 [Pristionchus mayeri]|uniref:Nuclear receptor n=1 Tax=Pristionchus mayeri TaxID=1317129 RepID=A0AAN5ICL6_9BILA|nr:hypothetical protein PMAYCL1PPCAC_31438 [Pristionchus mayeri]